MPNEKKANGTTHMQATYLKDRISLARRKANKAVHDLGALPVTAQIKAARALIKKFEKDEYASQERAQKAARVFLDRETDKVQQTVLFGTPESGLKAVADYERRIAEKYPEKTAA